MANRLENFKFYNSNDSSGLINEPLFPDVFIAGAVDDMTSVFLQNNNSKPLHLKCFL